MNARLVGAVVLGIGLAGVLAAAWVNEKAIRQAEEREHQRVRELLDERQRSLDETRGKLTAAEQVIAENRAHAAELKQGLEQMRAELLSRAEALRQTDVLTAPGVRRILERRGYTFGSQQDMGKGIATHLFEVERARVKFAALVFVKAESVWGVLIDCQGPVDASHDERHAALLDAVVDLQGVVPEVFEASVQAIDEEELVIDTGLRRNKGTVRTKTGWDVDVIEYLAFKAGASRGTLVQVGVHRPE